MMTTQRDSMCLLASLLLFIVLLILPVTSIPAEILSMSFEELSKSLTGNIPEKAITILGKPDKDFYVNERFGDNNSKTARYMIYYWDYDKKPYNITTYSSELNLYGKYDYIRIKILNGKIVYVNGQYYYIYK